MNYIGSKYKLLPFLRRAIYDVVGGDLSDKVLCDLFAGTGMVGRCLKTDVRKVIANDLEYYSYVLNRNYIGNHLARPNKEIYIKELNRIPVAEDGFIYQNYCWGSGSERLYFTDENGKRIDSIRQQIERWKEDREIDDDIYYFLLCSLLESADKVANTASVYGAFLKNIKKSASERLVLRAAEYDINCNQHEVYCEDANNLISRIEGDILYLDPPYNARQYGANYHMLNTIAEYKPFIPKGKTGLREYTRSLYCSTKDVVREFEQLLAKAKFRYIFLSYNNEGLMSVDQIKNIMSKFGRYDVVCKQYQRFKADKTENRNHIADSTTEYLHILEKI
jgi:adenine-specific DNA-methyltransferase